MMMGILKSKKVWVAVLGLFVAVGAISEDARQPLLDLVSIVMETLD